MYYPKSQITPNLYTNGNEFVYANTKEPYSGYYFKTSTGKYFTGRNQDDRPNVELIININMSDQQKPQQDQVIKAPKVDEEQKQKLIEEGSTLTAEESNK